MSVSEMKQMRRALDEHLERFERCMKTTPSCRLLRTYVAGQLGTLPRKSVEPIAEEAGIPARTLQQFLGLHRWDEDAAWRQLRELVKKDHGGVGDIGVFDETSYVKCGKNTAGVQRQYCGAVGKVENCVVSVGLVHAKLDGSFHAAIANELFLPKSWADDRERCRKAGIPDTVLYRPKWKMAVDQLRTAVAEGLPLRWFTADEGYGRFAEFRNAVAQAERLYVVEIPSNLMGWTVRPKVEVEGTVTDRGRKLKKDRVAVDEPAARSVNALWKRGGPSWRLYRIKDGEKGPLVWTVRETPFCPREKKGYIRVRHRPNWPLMRSGADIGWPPTQCEIAEESDQEYPHRP
jgi:SRSO17 transposase